MTLATDRGFGVVCVFDRLDTAALQAFTAMIHPERGVAVGIVGIDDRGFGQREIETHVARVIGIGRPHPEQQRGLVVTDDAWH